MLTPLGRQRSRECSATLSRPTRSTCAGSLLKGERSWMVRAAELPNCPQVDSPIAGHVRLGNLRPWPTTSPSSGRRLPRRATTTRAQDSRTYLRRCNRSPATSRSFCLFFELIVQRPFQGVNYAVWAGGHDDIGVAGTSCASPTAAGVFSLVNDKRLAAGKPTLGFMNPLLYKSKPCDCGAALVHCAALVGRWSLLNDYVVPQTQLRSLTLTLALEEAAPMGLSAFLDSLRSKAGIPLPALALLTTSRW